MISAFFRKRKRFFASAIKIVSGVFSIFQMSGEWFPWHPKGRCKFEVFFRHNGHEFKLYMYNNLGTLESLKQF